MYPGLVTTRARCGTWSWASWLMVLLCTIAGTGAAHAEKKKKPGFFDFRSWDFPVNHERNAADDLKPKGVR